MGRIFFYLWLGTEVTSQMIEVYYVFIMSFFLNSFGWLGFNILLVNGRLDIVALIYFAMLVVLLICCYFLSGILGVLGVAIAVLIARLLDVFLFVVSIQSHLVEFICAIKKSWLAIKVLILVLAMTILVNFLENELIELSSIYSLMFGAFFFTSFCVATHKYLSSNGYFP